ncbi:hypothetical protein SUGI_0859930 [Cryptomeria japonica]|uniref:ethylene receptor 2 n=1 Tax=Cryptomeria japonica TaxID=3369 RepID=UPI002414CD42|nr:ethylene receptor 2 [Cryptomeria japonica]XP_057858002.1 ethylene receptor 2 [Cryptomeria japonica]GLJ41549.1 hypothetical protein SUGI_0859930 [Cryptomeria japonica]
MHWFRYKGLVLVLVLHQAFVIGLSDGIAYNCEDDGWSVETIHQCQKISDFLIALAYFSIPLELLYFVSCSSSFPFRWVLFQFGAFIVLCGLTHFVSIWAYELPSFRVMLALTIFKVFTAFVSSATAITLVTLIPQLLRVKVREVFLKNKAIELNREVGLMKKQEEASWHVRMLTQEIRSSLDRHTILNTTLIELSKVLNLENCTIWMPSEDRTLMELTHELKRRLLQEKITIPIADPDVVKTKGSASVVILKSGSILGKASSHQWLLSGEMAAIRMPMLKASNFKGGTPELVETSYAILVLVLPSKGKRVWSSQELEIVEVVADQVAVALSHAAVLEESQQMRDRLVDQNKSLQRARQDAVMANQARNSFQRVMNHEMRRPMHSICGLSSILQAENWKDEQRPLVDMLAKSSSLLNTLVNDIMDALYLENNTLKLELHFFQLPVMLKEAAYLTKQMCMSKGIQFGTNIGADIPKYVIGDEKRIFQTVMHTVGNVSNYIKKGAITLNVSVQNRDDGRWDPGNTAWRPSLCEGFVFLRFEVRSTASGYDGVNFLKFSKAMQQDKSYSPSFIGAGLGFSICKRFVQLMHGNIWIEPDSHGVGHVVTFIIRLQLQASSGSNLRVPDVETSYKSNFKGLKVLLADDNRVNCAVSRRLLEKLGFQTTVTDTGYQCLRKLFEPGCVFHLILLEMCMPEMDGYEVACHIRQKFRPANRPLIVALTAHSSKVIEDRCLEIGMAGVIWKPISLRELSNVLFKIIHQRDAILDNE